MTYILVTIFYLPLILLNLLFYSDSYYNLKEIPLFIHKSIQQLCPPISNAPDIQRPSPSLHLDF